MNEDNLKKSLITKSKVIVSIIISILLLTISILLYLFLKMYRNNIEYITNTIIGITTATIAFLGVEIVKNYPIKDNPYYQFHYSKSEIDKIVNARINKEDFDIKYSTEIYPFIKNLQKDNTYFEKVDFLENTNLEFSKLWNENNYYNSRPSKENKERLFEIKRTLNSIIYDRFHNC